MKHNKKVDICSAFFVLIFIKNYSIIKIIRKIILMRGDFCGELYTAIQYNE